MVINDYSNLTMAPFQGSSCPATSSCQGIARELLSIITWEKAWRKVNFQKLVKIWPPLRHSVRKCAVRFSGAINEAKMEAPQKHRKTGPGGGFFGVEKNFVAWTAWWFQTFFIFYMLGIILPIDELIFFKPVNYMNLYDLICLFMILITIL